MASIMNLTEVKQGSSGSPQLPLVDLSKLGGPEHDKVAKTIIHAAQTCGFFQVVNHGLPVQFLEELKHLIHRFFNQPEEDKQVYSKEFGVGPLVRYAQNPAPEMMEFLLMRSTKKDDGLQYWPDTCKELAVKYQNLSSDLAETILRVLLKDLGVQLDDSMVEAYTGEKLVGMNHYLTWPTQHLDLVSSRKHTDNSVLTVLFQDHVGGLLGKLRDDGDMENNYKGEWVEITPTPGALVILVGDCLQVLSNGIYKGGEHFIQTTGRKARVSSTVFMNPKPSTNIRPLTQIVEKDGGKPRYKEFLFGEYEAYKHECYYRGVKAIDTLRIF